MAHHELGKQQVYSSLYSPYQEPILTVEPGDSLTVYTEDAFASRITSEDAPIQEALAGMKHLNPQTGPIYIKGAEPGDVLAVHIENIELARDWGVSVILGYGGSLQTDGDMTFQKPLGEYTWIWKTTDNGKTWKNDRIGVPVPAAPFCGTLAVAPELEAIQSITAGPFGGNMDCCHVCAGNTVYLPISNPGALFYIGDCHAAQGQGELCGGAIEITAKVTVSFELIKNKPLSWPRIESKDKIMSVGSAKPMEEAARIAAADLVRWMAADYGFELMDAYELFTQAGELFVASMVNPSYTLCAAIEKKYLER